MSVINNMLKNIDQRQTAQRNQQSGGVDIPLYAITTMYYLKC
ncbi:hypothetical protein P4S68_12570 [Pseudoalteromonas sp. Hal099]